MPNPLKPIVKAEHAVADRVVSVKQSVFARFPLLFTLLGTFGLVGTYYGFEHLIDQVTLFRDNPIILLGVGVGTLALTGTLYKKLD